MRSFVLLLVFVSVAYANNNVYAVNNRLMVNDAEWIVKGLDYVPSPMGQSGMASTGYGGTGFCSAKLTPWNEWKSACYDSDYYDGSPDVDPTRFPTGFKPIWDRDFDNIKATGANTIRLYNANPSVRAATQLYTNLFPSPTGKDHTQFMAKCEQYGIKVIFPLFIDDSSYASFDAVTFKRYLRWQIDEVGNSSALLMWQLGNEQSWMWPNSNQWNSTTGTAKYNSYVNYIKRYTKSKWNRIIPVTAAIPNVASIFNFEYTQWHVDVFSANVFGLSWGNLFTGATDGSFDGVNALACRNNKPFLITECGPTYKTGQTYPAGAFNQIWSSVVSNVKNGPLLGALYFELTDEPALGKNFGLFSVSPAVNAQGQNSTQSNVFLPDAIARKPVYDDIVSGSYNGVQYNMNANMYSLIGRNPYTTSTAPDTCGSSYKACPGTGYPKCSGNGVCSRITGTCTCATGWAGADCSQAVCPGSDCSGRGICSSLVTPPECVCQAGYFGLACQSLVSSVPAGQCPGGCSVGNGVCNTTTGKCACWPGWAGADCAITDLGIGFSDSTSNSIAPYYSACLKFSTSTSLKAAPTSTTMTNQKCRYYCALRNYDYSATRGQSCDCLSQATEAAAQVYASSSCATTCPGDQSQICGGSSGFSAYIAGSAYKTGYVGCYIDTATRDLPVLFARGSTVTIDSCRKGCAAQGYLYTGMQNGDECWCGSSYGNQGGVVDDSQCNVACSGDSSLNCGAGYRNSIYTVGLSSGYAFY